MNESVNKIIWGYVPEALKQLTSESINCVVTSPPYWALRDYGVKPQIWDGDGNCEHEWETRTYRIGNRAGNKDRNQPFFTQRHNVNEQYKASMPTADFCLKCQAWRGSLGLEPDFNLYIQHLVGIFDGIKRVLRKDGTCWVNLGDTYSGNMGKRNGWTDNKLGFERQEAIDKGVCLTNKTKFLYSAPDKSLCLIPFRFAIEMVNRGWVLRNTIIWHKPNCMPSSVKDRFTADFEYVFFFVRSKKYWFETQYENSLYKIKQSERQQYLIDRLYQIKKYIRDEKIANQGKSKYFSQYNNVLANAKAYRTGLKILQEQEHLTKEELIFLRDYTQNHFSRPQGRNKRAVWTITTKPFKEAHFATFPEKLVEPMIKAGCPGKGVVLDPFCGSGTTLLMAKKLGRNYIGIDINPEYVKMSKRRINGYTD